MKFQWAGRALGVALALACLLAAPAPVYAQSTATGTYATFGQNDGGQKQAVAPVAVISGAGCAVGTTGCALQTTNSDGSTTVSGSASSATTISNFPITVPLNASSFSVQWTAAGAGNQAMYKGSNDGVTFFALPCVFSNLGTGGLGIASAATGMSIATGSPVVCPTQGFKQVSVVISSYASGTPAATVQFSPAISPFNESFIAATYLTTPPTYSNTNVGPLSMGTRGGLHADIYGADSTSGVAAGTYGNSDGNSASTVLLATTAWLQTFNGTTEDRTRNGPNAATAGAGLGSVSTEEDGRVYLHLAASGTSAAVKSGKGNLHSVTVNACVASATITLDDALTATTPTMAVITCPSTITSLAPFTLTYDIAFTTGLTVVQSGNTDITVSYR